MRILFLDAYFLPERIAFTHLEQDLIKGLVDAGHEIEVLCPTPSRGIDDELAKKYSSIRDEYMHNGRVHIKRFPLMKEGKGTIKRAIRYFIQVAKEECLGKKYKDIDLVVALSTPPIQGEMAGRVAKALGCPFLYLLQDIFPDSLVTSGISKAKSIPYRIGEGIANRTYSLANKIIVPAASFKKLLIERGVDESKIEFIPNWVDSDSIDAVAKENNSLYAEFGISKDKFTVLYAGNIGEAQGAEILLDVAESFRDDERIQFVIFGGGSKFDDVVEATATRSISNMIVNPLLPLDRVAEVYSLADVAVITAKPGVGKAGIPSKTWSIMACNTPIILSFDKDSELAEIVSEAKAGISAPPADATALREAILNMLECGAEEYKNGRKYVTEVVSRVKCVDSYISIIDELSKKQSVE